MANFKGAVVVNKVIIMLLCRNPTLVSGVQVVVLYAPTGVSLFKK